MNANGQTEWLSPGFTWLIILAACTWFTVWFVITWQRTKWERDLPRLLDDPVRAATTCEVHGHIWQRYSNYRLCLRCPTKEYLP